MIVYLVRNRAGEQAIEVRTCIARGNMGRRLNCWVSNETSAG